MAQGEVYAEVDASVVNGGIAPMAMVSGNPAPVDGQSYVVVWIRWKYDDSTGDGGFTGTGWHYDDSTNNIVKRYPVETDFKNWLTTEKPSNLDSVLSDWSADDKATFLNNNLAVLQGGGCLYFTGNDN